MATTRPLLDSPAFEMVQRDHPHLHVRLLTLDRWELINRDMVPRTQEVRRVLAARVEDLADRPSEDEHSAILATSIVWLLVESFAAHDGAIGHEHTLNGVKNLAAMPKVFDDALRFFFDLAATFLTNARSRYRMRLLVERDVVRSYDRALFILIARHLARTRNMSAVLQWDAQWTIHRIESFRQEFEERYDGLLSVFGGTTLFKDPYFSDAYRLLVCVQRRKFAEMVSAKAVGYWLPQELVDCISQYLYSDTDLDLLVTQTLNPPRVSS